jgi:protein O-mannosyl-transferase
MVKKNVGRHDIQDGPRSRQDPGRAARGKIFWLIALLSAGVYLNTLHSDFTYDDFDIVAKNQMITSLSNVPRLFTSTYWAGLDSAPDRSLYRPLTMTTYALEYKLHGLRPGWFHVVNVLLHALTASVLFLTLWEIFRDETLALISAGLFAVHPIHTEAVSSIVGRAEILALLGILVCILGYFRALRARGAGAWAWSLVSVLAYSAGMFSKEVGITAPAVIIMTHALIPVHRGLLRRRQQAMAIYAAYAVSAVAFLLLRSQAVTGRAIHAGFVHVPAQVRVLTAVRVLMEYLGLLFAPTRLTADYWLVPAARSLIEPGALAGVLTVIGAAVIVAWSWRKHPAIAWGLCFFAITIFPVSNIPFGIGIMKAERILYSPSAGFTAAAGGALVALLARRSTRRASAAGIAVIVILLSIMTWERNRDWKDNFTLATATLKRTPNSPNFNVVMGQWYRVHNNNPEAKRYYLVAAAAFARDKTSLFNLGNIESDDGSLEQAVAYYQQALAVDSLYLDALNNLGNAYHRLGRFDEAAETFRRFMRLKPDDPHPYLNLMAVYVDQKNYGAALPLAYEALSRFPDVADIQFNAAAIFGLLKLEAEAQEAYRRAQELEKSARPSR